MYALASFSNVALIFAISSEIDTYFLSSEISGRKLFLCESASSLSRVHLRLKPYSYRKVVKALSKLGFTIIRQRGSHIILKGSYKGMDRTVVVPRHGEIAVGTLRSILFQTGITIEEFIDLIEEG
jgi:predicted RNA binding protein YcfA (HicA-like mRNA interferase family)